MYSREDLRVLRWLHARLAEGMTIGRAVALLHASAKALDSPPEARPPAELARDLTVACSRFDERAAMQVMRAAAAGLGPEAACLDVFAPALDHLGAPAADHAEALGPAHFASVAMHALLLELYEGARTPSLGPLVLLAGAPGEVHDLGVLMVALLARLGGLRTLLLGPVGHPGVVFETSRQQHPAVVALSSSAPETARAALRVARELRCDAEGSHPLVVVGGQGFAKPDAAMASAGALWGGPDARGALRVLHALCGRSAADE